MNTLNLVNQAATGTMMVSPESALKEKKAGGATDASPAADTYRSTAQDLDAEYERRMKEMILRTKQQFHNAREVMDTPRKELFSKCKELENYAYSIVTKSLTSMALPFGLMTLSGVLCCINPWAPDTMAYTGTLMATMVASGGIGLAIATKFIHPPKVEKVMKELLCQQFLQDTPAEVK